MTDQPMRKPTARGRPQPTRPVGYHWRLEELMAKAEMRKTVELGPLLAERGVVLSDAQVYRLVHYVPERLSLKTLAALCDIFGCTPNDIVTVHVEGAQRVRAVRSPKLKHDSGGAAPLPTGFKPVKADVLRRTRKP